jgi:UDP-N-acetylglucosamine acyltransferase
MSASSTHIHPTACVHPDARLAPGVQIGAFAVIEADVDIGADTEIGAHVVIRNHVRLGARNRIHAHVVLGGEPQDLSFRPCLSEVVIGDDNTLREAVTVHRGHREGGSTRLGHRNYLMVNTHIAHDCRLGDDIIMANNSTLAGHVSLGDRAFISGHVAIHQFARVGRLAMVAGLAKVVQDCLPFVITDGNPARARGLNVVGLRRAGFTPPQIAAIRRGYKELLRSARPLKEALELLAAADEPAVQELAEFIRGSKRGFAHLARRSKAGSSEE